MMNRLKVIPLTIFTALTSSLFAVNVTLNVDMSDVTVSENGVHVAGSFQGWDPAATPLTDEDGDGIYTVVIDMSGVSDETVFFKYINGNSWGNDETVSDPVCGGGGGGASDRFLDVPEVDTVLDPVCFSECIGCDESYVHFAVDVDGYEITDGVRVAGSFNAWDANTDYMMDAGEGVYTMAKAFDEGSTIEWKYVLNGTTWEELGEDVCTTGGGYVNRTVTVSENNMMFDPVPCYASCYECGGAPLTASVTFQADMSVLLSQGWDVNTHFMELRGGVNGWAAGDNFQEDLTDPSLYSITKEITAVPGSVQEWKFKANPDESFNNDGWEAAANRTFYFWGDDIVLDPEVPVILPIGPLANAVEVEIHATFYEGTLNANNGEPFPVTPDTLVMNGSFMNCWCTWGNCMGSSCAEKVSPDVPRLVDVDGDGVYTGTLSLPAGHGNVFTYKLGAYYPGVEEIPGENGSMDNEAGFGADKVYYIPTDASGTVVLETVFGDNNPANPFLPRTITLHVDMNNQEVSDDGVHVAGSFQGWDPTGTELLDPDMDGIYAVDIEAQAGDTLYYKFLNGNSWGSDESVPDPVCGGAGGYGNDRFLVVPDVDTMLPPVCFGECISCDESYVVFHVDMEETTVAAEGVFLGGGQWHDNWVPMTLVEGEETIYRVKMVLPEGSHYYKFNNGGNGDGYEDGGSLTNEGCGDGDNWGDRTIVVGEEDFMTPPFCFSSCYTCGGDPVEANVTFQADMTTLLSQGWDVNTHFMELRGGMNGWAAGDVFQEDLTDPSLYTLTLTLMAVPGSMHEWKFKANPDENFNNGGWETAANRLFEFTGEDLVLPASQPAILPVGELQNDLMVEIHAMWMMNTQNVNTGAYFLEHPDTLVMNGSFLNCWCTWGDCMGPECASSCSPDVPRLTDPDGDGVFTGELMLPAGHGNVFTYKLGAYYPGIENEGGENGAMDNEAGFGSDKTFYVDTDASGTVLLQTVFGDNNPANPWAGPGGYLANGGFEEGPASWGSYPTELDNWEVNDMHPFEGMHSLKISPRTMDGANPEWTPVFQSFTPEGLNLVPGNYIHVHGHAMTPSEDAITGDNHGYIFIQYFDASWSEITLTKSEVVDASATSDMWHELMVSAVVPDGAVNINVGCELWQGPEADAGAVYFDNLGMMISTGDELSSDEDIVTPKEFALLGNYPNPFNPVTTLRFDLDYTSMVNITVYNILGNEIITLQNGELRAGRHAIQWNANNTYGQKVPSGLYLYKVTSDKRNLTGKMLLMK